MPDGTEGKGGPRIRGDLWPAILALAEALKDADSMVRTNSAKSIGLLMRYRGIPEKADQRAETTALAMIAALNDSDDMVRTAVAWELDTVANLSLWAVTRMGDLAELRRRWAALLKETRGRGGASRAGSSAPRSR